MKEFSRGLLVGCAIGLLAGLVLLLLWQYDVEISYFELYSGRREMRRSVLLVFSSTKPLPSPLADAYLSYVGDYPQEERWERDTGYWRVPLLGHHGHYPYAEVVNSGRLLAEALLDDSDRASASTRAHLSDAVKAELILRFLKLARECDRPSDAQNYGLALWRRVESTSASLEAEDFPRPEEYLADPRSW